MAERLAIDGGTPVRDRPLPGPPREVGEAELRQLSEVIASGQMNRVGGTKVKQFEEAFARFYGVRRAIACTSGTAALHLAVGALNPDPGDEIITAPITDLGTVIPILAQNAIPVFADVDLATFNIDPADVERRVTPRTRAIIPVHLGGNPCDMEALLAIARRHNLMVIEDCSQAYCAESQGRRVGTMGAIGCFSLQQSKHITCGDGGITISDDEDLARRAALFSDKGWPRDVPGNRQYLSFGYNYRMSELNGAVALAQVDRLPSVVERRVARGRRLTQRLAGMPGVHPQRVREGDTSVFWFYALRIVEAECGIAPERFAACLRAEGIGAGHSYIGKPLYLHDALRKKRVYGNSDFPFNLQDPAHAVRYEEGECPRCEQLLREMLVLPLHEAFTDADVDDIARAFEKILAA